MACKENNVTHYRNNQQYYNMACKENNRNNQYYIIWRVKKRT